jgi:hypothetical protein
LPNLRLPAFAGAAVVVLALPLFLAAGWPLVGWGVAAALWAAVQVFGLVAVRLAPRDASLQAVGIAAFVRMFRLLAIVATLAVLAATRRDLVLPVIAVYGLAYTCELGLSLLTYFGGEAL